MVLLVTIAFFMAVAGCFIMLELSPFAFLDGLSGYLKPKNDSIRSKVKDSRKKKEVKGLQLLFEDVPSAEVRALLKRNGFRYAPSSHAWQRQLTDNARRALSSLLPQLESILKEE